MKIKLKCDQCGKCCIGPMILIIKPSDYRRWVEQERHDILKYTTKPPLRGYSDFLGDMTNTEDSAYCPCAKKTVDGKFECIIQETKPEVCRKFYCEWCYGIGKKGVPFRTALGWTDKAKKLGYGQPRIKKSSESR